MADIRLRKITIEPSETLIMHNGNINITNTSLSNSRLTGALVINGGLAINNTYDSVSSTSGGALTIGGGLAVFNQSFFGNNIILDSNYGTLSVIGISNKRLFLDTITNKNFYVSPDGVSKRFDLYDTELNINITKSSTNASTGGLVINGGLSINCTTNSINSSNGGALTVGGGISIGGDSQLSKSLTLGESYSDNTGLLIRYTGVSQIALENSSGNSNSTINMNNNKLVVSNEDDMLFNTTIGNFIFSNASTSNTLLTITGNYSIFDKYVNITDTIDSLNKTTASLIVSGGISIQSTRDAISFTSGGALTINGGVAINKKTYTNDSIGIELSNNNKNNKLMLYQLNSDLTQTNLYTGLGVNNGSLRLQLSDTTNDYLFYSSNTSGSSTEVFRIKGTNEVQFIGNSQRYSILGGGNTNNDLTIQGQTIATPSSLCLFTKDGDTTANCDIKIFGNGLPNSVLNSEYIKLGWDTTDLNYIISTNKSGSGVDTPLVMQTNNNTQQLKLVTNGTIYMSSTLGSINSSTGGLIMMGGVSISNTSDAISLTQGGSITMNGGMSVMKSIYVGNTLNIYSTGGNISLYSQNTSGDLLISNPTNKFIFAGNNTSTTYNNNISFFSLNNDNVSNYEVLSISNNNSIYNLNSDAGGSGILHPIQINIGSNTGVFLTTSGNIGINLVNPEYQLDINGSVQANDYSYFNQLTVYSTDEAFDEFTSGSLSVMGGASITKNLFVGGQSTFTNTTDSSSTSASVYMAGGLTIASGQSSNYGFGALTVLGGGYFGGELYVQQNLNVNGSINGGGSSSSTFAYFTLTATDESVNLSSGSLVSFGGITIDTYANSQNVSNGGSFLTAGGASIGKDLYIGGDLYNYGIENFYNNTNNLINFYDISNIIRFSIDRDTSNNNFSISRYDNTGSFIEKNIDISNSSGKITLNNSAISTGVNTGSLVTIGGITINATENAGSLNNGGALSVFGGTSISKDLYVGGDVILSSTTDSTNSNEGALKIAGGVGINGNVNINGNTVITGNLSILGTTNSVYSTNTLLSDNILVINSGPSGTSDGGVLVQRYQLDNDIGDGDVVNDITNTEKTYIIPNQSGMTNLEIKLSTLADSTDDYYIGWWIKITSGFSNNQVRKIIGYTGSTRIATIDAIWTTQNPSIGDSVNIYNKPYVGLIWNEIRDRFDLGASVSDPGNSNVTLTEYVSLHASNITLYNTINSNSSSVGSLILAGGMSIQTTEDATSLTSGNALTISGGASIAKSLYVGTKMYIAGVDVTPNTYDIFGSVIYNASNNVVSENINTLLFPNSVFGFDIYLSARLIATNNLYSNYHIRGVNKGLTWEIITSYVGDSIATFNITNDGQLQYTTPNFTGFTNLTFKYKVFTN
jgi:hypothetical protein